MAEKNQKASLFEVYQSLQNAGTASVYGRYLSRDSAQRAVDQALAGGLTAHREASYFIQEVQVEQVAGGRQDEHDVNAKPEEKEFTMNEAGYQVRKGQAAPAAAVTPVAGVTATEEGDALNVPNKQLADQDEDPHSRHLRTAAKHSKK